MTSSLSSFRQLFALLSFQRKLVITFIVTTLLASATEGFGVGLIVPLLEGESSQWASNATWIGAPVRYIKALTLVGRVRLVGVVLFVVVLVQSGLRYLERLIALKLHVGIESVLKRHAIQQVYRVSLQFVNRHSTGDLLTVLVLHTRQAASIVPALASIAANVMVMLVYTSLMLVLSWQLTLLAAGLLIPLLLLNQRLNADRLRIEGEAHIAKQREVRKVIIENLSLIKLSHLYAQQTQSIKRCDEIFDQYLHHFYQSQKLIHRSTPLFSASAVLGLSILLIAGTFFHPEQTETWLGRTVLFLLIVFRLLSPATAINRLHAEVCNHYPSLKSALDFLDRNNKPYLKNGDIRFERLKDRILFDEVTFRYASNEPPVLENVCFSIPRGKVTAIVGASGSGKSTIISLLARLYDCEEGRIQVDQFNLRELDVASWREQLAIVSQENLLYNDTVMANIRFSRPNASDEQIYQATRLAQLDDFIRSLPDGYQTIIGDNGLRLSGGQQQRLAIARAMVADPQILVLDEATSALDSETERAIQIALEEFGKSRTLLVAAHRLSTIRKADNIVVLANAKVIEQGTHDQLMECNGLYRKLVETQTLGQDPAHAPHKQHPAHVYTLTEVAPTALLDQ